MLEIINIEESQDKVIHEMEENASSVSQGSFAKAKDELVLRTETLQICYGQFVDKVQKEVEELMLETIKTKESQA